MLLFLLLIPAGVIGVTFVLAILLIPVIVYRVVVNRSMLDNPEIWEKIEMTI